MSTSSGHLISAAISTLYECATDESCWASALLAMGKAFDSPRVGLLRTSPKIDVVYDLKGLNFDLETQRAYNDYYWRLDPTLDPNLIGQQGHWEDAGHLFDPRTTPHREYVHDFAIPGGLRYVAGGNVHSDEEGCVLLGLQRPADASPFDERSKAIFNEIRPHLQRVSVISRELNCARRTVALSAAAISGLAQPAYVLSPSGALLFANEAGLNQLRARSPFQHRNGRLEVSSKDQQRFIAALRGATREPRCVGADLIAGNAGSSWVLRIAPISGDPSGALVYASPARGRLPPTPTLQRLFGLTQAEADVASRSAQGQTIKEIAFARQVSELTVRAQVRSVLSKTGARRLSALSGLLQGIPVLSRDDQRH